MSDIKNEEMRQKRIFDKKKQMSMYQKSATNTILSSTDEMLRATTDLNLAKEPEEWMKEQQL